MGAIFAVLALALLMGRKNGAQIIYPGQAGFDWGPGPATWETEESTGKPWRTISPGRIPTAYGGSIPIPVKWPGGVVDVNKMLKPVGVIEAVYTEPAPGVVDINKMLRDVEEEPSPEPLPRARPGSRYSIR